MDGEEERRKKAAARAYALSDTSSTAGSQRRRRTRPPATAERKKEEKKRKRTDAVVVDDDINNNGDGGDDGNGDEDDDVMDDYDFFVKTLNASSDDLGDLLRLIGGDDDDEDEFVLDPFEAEDDDDDDDGDDDDDDEEDEEEIDRRDGEKGPAGEALAGKSPATPPQQHEKKQGSRDSSPLRSDNDLDPSFCQQLEEELDLLEEEDMEASVAALWRGRLPDPHHAVGDDSAPGSAFAAEHRRSDAGSMSPLPLVQKTSIRSPLSRRHQHPHPFGADGRQDERRAVDEANVSRPATAAAAAAVTSSHQEASEEQQQRLRKLMKQHHQLLLQQSVLAVRSGTRHREGLTTAESSDDYAQLLDSAVGMLQDLDQNRKDALRRYIQFPVAARRNRNYGTGPSVPYSAVGTVATTGGSAIDASNDVANPRHDAPPPANGERRLTRAAFSRTLQEDESGKNHDSGSAFAVPGLSRQGATFNYIDGAFRPDKQSTSDNILRPDSHEAACRKVLEFAGAEVTESLVPGANEVASNFTDAEEYAGMSDLSMRNDRELFTFGEDNLILRGVNLFGDRQWKQISGKGSKSYPMLVRYKTSGDPCSTGCSR